ncbi:MAG: bifunctional glutamate N-acetyltransferase/amino-acid acetyltransferase ArgJ [Herpetosiphonaceae bacterium]|nr:bifunctional glutamate N-acetyltransferase/amino-acid acetyltransferase ArgJ [Herpetosiphonaceae bacterium]
MESIIELLASGAVTTAPGFMAAGVAAGIKKRGGLDVALVSSTSPCVTAGVFTQNAVKAAPVLFDQQVLAQNPAGIRAVVINSGCANAVTGEQGSANTAATAEAVAAALNLDRHSVLVMSTGVIGQQLPMDRLRVGIWTAAKALAPSVGSGHLAAQAIMTTDTRPKEAAGRVMIDGVPITISGMCKGSGMIEPNMATMLAIICTDAVIDPPALQSALRYATDRSFNAMTVDGDTSTNDTLVVLANGRAGGAPLMAGTPSWLQFRDALTVVAAELAKQVARDGEGATKFVTIKVEHGRSFGEAMRIAKTIANSPLVKTAIFGADANWGRVLMAAGRAGVPLDPRRLALWFDQLQLLADGAPLPYEEADAHATLAKPEVTITLDLGLGDEAATVWTCDLSHEYVSINADYRT